MLWRVRIHIPVRQGERERERKRTYSLLDNVYAIQILDSYSATPMVLYLKVYIRKTFWNWRVLNASSYIFCYLKGSTTSNNRNLMSIGGYHPGSFFLVFNSGNPVAFMTGIHDSFFYDALSYLFSIICHVQACHLNHAKI